MRPYVPPLGLDQENGRHLGHGEMSGRAGQSDHDGRTAADADDAWDDGALMRAYDEAVERYKRAHNLVGSPGSGAPVTLSPSVGVGRRTTRAGERPPPGAAHAAAAGDTGASPSVNAPPAAPQGVRSPSSNNTAPSVGRMASAPSPVGPAGRSQPERSSLGMGEGAGAGLGSPAGTLGGDAPRAAIGMASGGGSVTAAADPQAAAVPRPNNHENKQNDPASREGEGGSSGYFDDYYADHNVYSMWDACYGYGYEPGHGYGGGGEYDQYYPQQQAAAPGPPPHPSQQRAHGSERGVPQGVPPYRAPPPPRHPRPYGYDDDNYGYHFPPPHHRRPWHPHHHRSPPPPGPSHHTYAAATPPPPGTTPSAEAPREGFFGDHGDYADDGATYAYSQPGDRPPSGPSSAPGWGKDLGQSARAAAAAAFTSGAVSREREQGTAADDDVDELANLLMSWYYAGYYTGSYSRQPPRATRREQDEWRHGRWGQGFGPAVPPYDSRAGTFSWHRGRPPKY